MDVSMVPRKSRVGRAFPALVVATGVVALLVALTATAGSDTRIDRAYYESNEVTLRIPSALSANPNQFRSGCFDLGPNEKWPRPTATFYILLLPGATLASCADGSLLHDHVISTAPGAAGYNAAWRVVRVTPGRYFDIRKMPYTSEGELLAGAAADELILTDTGKSIRAPVVGTTA